MYMFELYDVMFFVKSIKSPSPCFHITDFISFSYSNTRSPTTNKLQHIYSTNNFVKNLYFNRLEDYSIIGTPYPQLTCHYQSQLSGPDFTNFLELFFA